MTLDNPLEHFITRANKIHNNKFDYSKIKDYKNQKTEVEIIHTIRQACLASADRFCEYWWFQIQVLIRC